MIDINESYVSAGAVKAIFKTASKLADTSHLASWDKYRDDISVADLQQAWKDGGYSDDIRDIAVILRDSGFGDREIGKVFRQVLGKGDDPDYAYSKESTNPAIGKLADIINKEGLADQVVAFLEKNFKDEIEDKGWIASKFSKLKKKFTTEDIREIFTSIVNEERSERESLLKKHETQQFGRKRK